MVNLSVFQSRLLPYVLGCPEPLARQALLDSAINFCTDASAVSAMIDPITVVSGVASYELEPPPQQTIATVLRVWHDGRLVQPVPYEQATNLFNTPNGTPHSYFGEHLDEIYSITFLPAPDKTLQDGLRVRAALAPSRSATEVATILYDRYADAIVQGAIALLASVPDQSYTDINQAAGAAMRARALTAAARGEVMHGNVQSSMSVKMRAF